MFMNKFLEKQRHRTKKKSKLIRKIISVVYSTHSFYLTLLSGWGKNSCEGPVATPGYPMPSVNNEVLNPLLWYGDARVAPEPPTQSSQV